VNSTLGISPTTVDFVKEAAMSNMTEIADSTQATIGSRTHGLWMPGTS
jgi:hypothetical protein